MEQSQTPAGLLCPNCRADLVMSERRGVEIDYCPKCRGVWLDRGELDTIVERAVAEAKATAAPAASFLPADPAQAVWPGQPAQQQTGYEPSRDYRRDDHGHHDDHRRRHGDHDDHDNRGGRRESFLGRLFD